MHRGRRRRLNLAHRTGAKPPMTERTTAWRSIALPLLLLVASASPVAAQAVGDPDAGRHLSQTWCANCHVVSVGHADGPERIPADPAPPDAGPSPQPKRNRRRIGLHPQPEAATEAVIPGTALPDDLRVRREITESTATTRDHPCTVMLREGAPSTVCSAGLEKDVAGRPPPTMTVSNDGAVLVAIISRRTLTAG
jgi:hypothetical protein